MWTCDIALDIYTHDYNLVHMASSQQQSYKSTKQKYQCICQKGVNCHGACSLRKVPASCHTPAIMRDTFNDKSYSTVYTNNILTLFGKIMSQYGEFQFENLDAQVIDTGINKYVFLSGTASIIIVYQMSI